VKFSIITTIYCWHDLKKRQLERCKKSVDKQSFKDLEHIIVDDGSPADYVPVDASFVQPHLERVNALREAMKLAKGEWFVFLDADDELASYYLEAVNQMIEKNPTYKMFNFGSLHVHKDYNANVRGPFKPKELEVGHEVFGGGNIVNGTYVFHRSVYDDLGGFPDSLDDVDTTEINYGCVRSLAMSSPFDFSAAAQIEFPEIRPYFMVGEGEPKTKTIKELGNPWGQDFYLFYKYTRKYHSKAYDIPLYIVHHEGKQDGEGHEIT